METILLIVSILLIIIVLLQSGKAESAGQIVQGGGSELFANTKERGIELFLTRVKIMNAKNLNQMKFMNCQFQLWILFQK